MIVAENRPLSANSSSSGTSNGSNNNNNSGSNNSLIATNVPTPEKEGHSSKGNFGGGTTLISNSYSNDHDSDIVLKGNISTVDKDMATTVEEGGTGGPESTTPEMAATDDGGEELQTFSDHSFPEPDFSVGNTENTTDFASDHPEDDEDANGDIAATASQERKTAAQEEEDPPSQQDVNGDDTPRKALNAPSSSPSQDATRDDEDPTEEREGDDHFPTVEDEDAFITSTDEAPPPTSAGNSYEDDVSITLSMGNSVAGASVNKLDNAPTNNNSTPFNPWATNKTATTRSVTGGGENLDLSGHSAATATKPRMVSFINDTGGSSVGPSSGGGGYSRSHMHHHQDDDDVSIRSQSTRHTMTSTIATTNNLALLARPLVETHMAVRVLKGEIHNILTVMRSSDHTLYMSAQRFMEEITEESHPLVQQFQDLHFTMSDWDLQMAAQALYRRQRTAATATTSGILSGEVDLSSTPEINATPDSLMYLPPFCIAVTTREINASVTGACLTALHKFLLYGFVHPARDAQAGITMIAKALLHCTFEETTAATAASHQAAIAAAKQRHQQWRKQLQQQQKSVLSSNNSVGSAETEQNSDPSRNGGNNNNSNDTAEGKKKKKKGKGGNNEADDSAEQPEQYAYYHPTRVNDEQVVLKLLDLAALVVRCAFLGPIVHQEHQIPLSTMTTSTGCFIDADLVVGLLNTCLHVSHVAQSASPLLKSAAADALAQIVLQVFSHQTPPSPLNNPIPMQIGGGNSGGASRPYTPPRYITPRQQVLAKLASLLNPANHDEQVIVSSLTAVNIALETSGQTTEDSMNPDEVAILQNDLFKYLLQWSTTSDLHILSLVLRVIFNLFQSIPNHLKVPLEVFLTSVHLRILDSSSKRAAAALASSLQRSTPSIRASTGKSLTDASAAGPNGGTLAAATPASVATSPWMQAGHYEEREVVLESILEFCQEPVLMQDIYRNYDCDVACTNLYELIVAALGRTAMPNDSEHPMLQAGSSSRNLFGKSSSGDSAGNSSTSGTSSTTPSPSKAASPARPSFFTVVNTTAQTAAFMQLNKLALEALCAILNSIARRVHADRSPLLRELGGNGTSFMMNNNSMSMMSMGNMSMSDSFMMDNMSQSQSQMSEDELVQRRQRKHALVQVAEVFNEDFMGHGWLDLAVNMDVLDSAENAKGVAEVLFTASKSMDKAKLGIYLSKGPDSSYPFHAKVREHFLAMYDFTGMSFAAALRLFLSKFRLPGEAQCIDRFMESFSSELFKQQQQHHEKLKEQEGMKDPENRQEVPSSIFKDADAIYVLSFSTIMLNTDLHNPTIKESNRMTKDQFIKNNRGINAGEDLPVEYLSNLYDQIKSNQIQVQREVGEFMKKQEYDKDFRSAWDSILSKHREVATAFFTHAGDARRNIYRAGVHDKEMFTILVKWALVALPAVFNRSWDDAIVFRSLRGFKQMAMIADHFGMDDVVNQIIEMLLVKGRDYVVNCLMLDHNPKNNTTNQGSATPTYTNNSTRSLETDGGEDETTQGDLHAEGTDTQIPYSLLSSGKGYTDIDHRGAAHHRGLLALDTGFLLVRRYARKVVSAWSIFIECLCAMRDAKALPSGLSDLDDFADSNGNVLPLSPYAKMSQRRLDHFYAAKAEANAKSGGGFGGSGQTQQQQEGWFTKLFKSTSSTYKPPTAEELSKSYDNRGGSGTGGGSGATMSEATRAVLAVAEAANVEKIVQMGSTKLPVAEQTIRSLLDVVDAFPYDDDPVAEQHAIFSLELAARALLSNRDRATEIFPVFLAKFENILGQISDKSVPSPFVIERIVVTILRCSIHLYDIEELRPNLRVSLHLLIMSVPRSFIRDVADRMACGLAIILRASFPFFESHNEWTFMGDTLDTLANFSSARVFVFDGIASTVECAVPSPESIFSNTRDDNDDYENETFDDSKAGEHNYTLTKEACGALSRILIRFVLGFYQSDFSLSVPASVCLEKLYYQMNSLILDEQAAAAAKAGNPIEVTEKDRKTKVPNKDYWQNVTVALYSVCRSPDPDVSRHGYEVCQRVILRTSLREIPVEKWMGILYLMVSKQPPTAADLSRSNTFVLLGNMLMRLLPYLSKKQRQPGTTEEKEENLVDGEDLTDIVRQTAALAGENLRNGRRGRVSPLFEKTLQTVTYLSNHMQTDEWKGEKEFGIWASEALLAELEKVGAAGASLQNQVAIQEKPREDDLDNEDQPEQLDGKEEGETEAKKPEEAESKSHDAEKKEENVDNVDNADDGGEVDDGEGDDEEE